MTTQTHVRRLHPQSELVGNSLGTVGPPDRRVTCETRRESKTQQPPSNRHAGKPRRGAAAPGDWAMQYSRSTGLSDTGSCRVVRSTTAPKMIDVASSVGGGTFIAGTAVAVSNLSS